MPAYPIGGRVITLKILIEYAKDNGFELRTIVDEPFVKRALVKGDRAVVLPFGGSEDDSTIINLEVPALLNRLGLDPIPPDFA